MTSGPTRSPQRRAAAARAGEAGGGRAGRVRLCEWDVTAPHGAARYARHCGASLRVGTRNGSTSTHLRRPSSSSLWSSRVAHRSGCV
eukprot:2092480-Prymnesium_polylepis.1